MEQQHDVQRAPTTDIIEEALHAHEAFGKLLQMLHAPEWLLLDLSMAQLKVLLLLDGEQALTIGQLAHKIRMAKSAASILVDKLVQGNYIERTEDATDRRRAIIRLTIKGADLAACLLRGKRAKMRTLLASMTSPDVQAFIQGMSALTAVAQAQLDDDVAPLCSE